MRSITKSFTTIRPIVWSLLAFIVSLLVYVSTLLPGPLGGDAGEFQYVGPLFTLAHATGYPLQVMLGWLWSKVVPIGTVAYRMNLLSAVLAALAVASTVYLLTRLGLNRVVAVITGFILAFGAAFWLEATGAEKYTFNVLFVTTLTGLALVWATKRDEPASDSRLYALSLVYGLSLLHHRSMLLFGPPLGLLVIFCLRSDLWRKPRQTLTALLLVFVPPLLVYPIMLPMLRERAELTVMIGRPDSLQEWLLWMLDRGYVDELFVSEGIGERLRVFIDILLTEYTVIPVLFAIVGVSSLMVGQPVLAAFLLLSFALQAGLSANYRAWDYPAKYNLPSFVVLLYAAAYGFEAAWAALRQRLAPRWHGWAGGFATSLLLLLPLYQVVTILPARRLAVSYGQPLDAFRQEIRTDGMGRRLASGMETLPPGSVLIGDWEQVTVFWYMQQIEGLRPDIEIVYPIERLSEFADDQRPVAIARYLSVDKRWHPTSSGPLIYLQRVPSSDIPAQMSSLGLTLYTQEGDPQFELVGHMSFEASYETGQHYPVTLVWRSLNEMDADYSMSLRILDESRNQVWARDSNAPVIGTYPTSRWESGEVVLDYHELGIAPDFPPGRYSWIIVVYVQKEDGTFENLVDSNGNAEIVAGVFDVLE